MPLFIDGHNLKGLSREEIMEAVNAPTDRHGVTPIELLFSKKENRLYCILDGPNKEAIDRHHRDIGLECEFITEADQIKTESLLRSEKLVAIGRLAGAVSHDLRNPLSVIKGSVQIIKKRLENHNDSMIADHLEILDRAISRMTYQIEEVLDFVRVSRVKLTDVPINSLIKQAIEKIPNTHNTKINLPQDITINCDVRQMEVVFINLIQNAIQAMNGEGEINIRCKKGKKNTQIELEDNGPGIAKNILPKIFEPLFTTKLQGSGLGLASCKSIIEQHKGEILVSSEIGKGSTFTIKIPN